MALMDELPENPYEENLDESAFQGVADAAGLAGKVALNKIADAIGLNKIKVVLIQGLLYLLIAVVAILLLYGAAHYIMEYFTQTLDDLLHWRDGVQEDTFINSYVDQAQQMLDAMNEGNFTLGNDMVMLSNEDFKRILEYVVQYNEDITYVTDPKIRYEYEQMEEGWRIIPNEIDPINGEPTYELMNSTWHERYGYQTVSYMTIGENYENPYTGENEFAVPWQTIVVLCEMMAEDNYENFGSNEDGWKEANADAFGSDYSFNTSMDGYFVTNAQVDAICNLVSYTYETYKVHGDSNNDMVYDKDYVEWTKEIVEQGRVHEDPFDDSSTYGIDLDFDRIKELSYDRQEDYNVPTEDTTQPLKEDGTPLQVYVRQVRVPAIAPICVANYYSKITYNYELTDNPEEAGAYQCVSMTIETDANRFMNMVKQYIPNFTFDHFLELLQMLPGTGEEVEKYKKIQELYERGELRRRMYELQGSTSGLTQTDVENGYKSITEIEDDIFPSYGIYVGNDADARVSPGTDFEGVNSIWIGTHYTADGSPHNTSRQGAPAVYNGWFPIADTARVTMNHSDGLSLDEVQAVLNKVAEWCWLDEETADNFRNEETAKALYEWQNGNDASVTAVLAIAYIEGNLRSGVAQDTWNFFNYGVGRNYREEYEPLYGTENQAFIAALLKQMNSINSNYLKAGQDTYLKMQWGEEFESTMPSQEYYQEAEKKITHSYCPWWDDMSFPFGAEGNRLSGIGWCNNCGSARETLLAEVGISTNTSYVWPVPDYTRISSLYGERETPTQGASSNHKGVDIAAESGKPIYAIADGVVTSITWNDYTEYNAEHGTDYKSTFTLQVKHDERMNGKQVISIYKHMENIPAVQQGAHVSAGQKIAEVGNGGVSTGPHLHIEIKVDGVNADPMNYLNEPTGGDNLSDYYKDLQDEIDNYYSENGIVADVDTEFQ